MHAQNPKTFDKNFVFASFNSVIHVLLNPIAQSCDASHFRILLFNTKCTSDAAAHRTAVDQSNQLKKLQ
jgi:hypothetical protein